MAIIKEESEAIKRCWLCGRTGPEKLDMHHIFGASNKKRSEKYGLLVPLCHGSCHIFGKNAVHNNANTMNVLRAWGQRKVMAEQSWSIEDFRKEFGKNYLDEE